MKQHRHFSLPGPDNITRVEMDNGITVLIYENHSAQSVVIGGSLNVGSIFEPPQQSGLASLTANALMRGTQQRDFETLFATLEDIGADLDFSGRTHKTGFSGKSLAEDFPVLLDVLADAVRRPTFPTAEVDRLKGEALTWLQYSFHHDTRYRAAKAFREALYPTNHPYHYSAFGDIETLSALHAQDLAAFHTQHYGPQGMIVVVVGNVEAEQALNVIRETLGDWQNPRQAAPPPLPSVVTPQKPTYTSVAMPRKSQADIILGVLGPERKSSDFVAASLLNSILGQFGMMGRIGAVIREEHGMAYYAYSRIEGGYGPGAWKIIAGVAPQNVEAAIELVKSEIRRITEELVSEEDLADNQSYFTGHLPLQLESNEGIATRLLLIESYGLGLDYLINYHDVIYSITRDDLLEVARRYWGGDGYVVAIAGPSGHDS